MWEGGSISLKPSRGGTGGAVEDMRLWVRVDGAGGISWMVVEVSTASDGATIPSRRTSVYGYLIPWKLLVFPSPKRLWWESIPSASRRDGRRTPCWASIKPGAADVAGCPRPCCSYWWARYRERSAASQAPSFHSSYAAPEKGPSRYRLT